MSLVALLTDYTIQNVLIGATFLGLISGVLVALKRGTQPVIISNLNPKYILRRLYDTPSALLYASPTLIATLTPDQHGVQRVREMMASHAPIHAP
jgi:3,4-dihydroxybenzoate---[aryl-carrier protein] ligase